MANEKKITQKQAAGMNQEEDILFHQKPDRRLLSYAPDSSGTRTNHDRRGQGSSDDDERYVKLQQDDKNGQRYLVDYEVTVRFSTGGKKQVCRMRGEDISTTGILLTLPSSAKDAHLQEAADIRLTFDIMPG